MAEANVATLPDSSFLYVSAQGERLFPYRSADGEVDPGMVVRSLKAIQENITLPKHVKARVARRARRIAIKQVRGKGMGSLEYKSVAAGESPEIKDEGIVVDYYAAFGNVDQGDDILHPGATVKSVEERFAKAERPLIRAIYGHDHSKVVGHPIRMEEDSHGAIAETKYNLETFWGNEAFHLVKAGDINGNSFGYLPGIGTKEQPGFTYDDDGIRHLHEVVVYEYGPQPFPMNTAAYTVGIKSDLDHDGPFVKLVEQAQNAVLDVLIEADALALRRETRKSGVDHLGAQHIEALEELMDVAEVAVSEIKGHVELTPPKAKAEGEGSSVDADSVARALRLKLDLARGRLRHAGITEG
jgi:HK97 family phage prohead protease